MTEIELELQKLQDELREEIERLEAELREEKEKYGVRDLDRIRQLTMELSEEEFQYEC